MRSLLLFVAALLLLPLGVSAKDVETVRQNVFYVPADQTVSGNVYKVGELVQIDGVVEGDVIAAGETVKINGTVMGDVIAAGARIIIAGPVLGDVRVAGGDVHIDSVVSKNLNVAAGNVRLTKSAAVGGEAVVFAGDLDMGGLIKQHVRGSVENAVLSGSVNNDVWLKAARLVLQPTAVIGGNLNYASPMAAQVMSGATIKGEVNFKAFEPVQKDKAAGVVAGLAMAAFIGIGLVKWLGFWLLALVIIWLMPKKLDKAMRLLDDGVWPTLGIGLLALIGVPVAGAIIALTMIGIPLAAVLFCLYALAVFAGKIIVCTYVGEWIIKQFTSRHWRSVSMVWSSLLGITLLLIVALIPFVGWLAAAFALAMGVGALVQFERHEMRRWR